MEIFEAVFLILFVLFIFAGALDMLGKKGRQTLLNQLSQRLEKLFSGRKNKEEG